MPTPTLPTRVTVTMSEYDSGGNPLEGYVRFTPTSRLKTVDGLAINAVPVTVPILGGAGSTQLVATDANGVTPLGWNYRVDKVLGAPPSSGALGIDATMRDTFFIQLPQALGSTALADLTRVDTPADVHFQVLTVSGVGPDIHGNVPLTGEDLQMSGVGFVGVGSIGQPNGVAGLDATGTVPLAQLKTGASGLAVLDSGGLLPVSAIPAISIVDTFTVASQAAMLALSAQKGDLAIRTDLANRVYILQGADPAVLANWTQISLNLPVGTTANTLAAGDDSRFTSLASRATSLETRATALENGNHARFARDASGSLVSGDNQMTFPIVRKSNSLVVPSAGNNYWTLQPGTWLIEAGTRLNGVNLAGIEMTFMTSTALDTTKVLANMGAQAKAPLAISVVSLSAATPVMCNLFNGTGASQAYAVLFGDANHISFTRLGNA